MTYEMKFTFEDGSSGYLSHYGVKGMKKGKHVMAKNEDYLRALGLLGPAAGSNPLTANNQLATGQLGPAKLMGRPVPGQTGLARPAVKIDPSTLKSQQARQAQPAAKVKKDFDARDYGFKDNSVKSRRAARYDTWGTLAEKGKMSREQAHKELEKTMERHSNKDMPWFKHPDGTPMTKAERQKEIADTREKLTSMANSFKSKKQLNAELKKKNAYLAETRANKQYTKDPDKLREMQRRTDAMYGRKGAEAQRVEAQRRRRVKDKQEQRYTQIKQAAQAKSAAREQARKQEQEARRAEYEKRKKQRGFFHVKSLQESLQDMHDYS